MRYDASYESYNEVPTYWIASVFEGRCADKRLLFGLAAFDVEPRACFCTSMDAAGKHIFFLPRMPLINYHCSSKLYESAFVMVSVADYRSPAADFAVRSTCR